MLHTDRLSLVVLCAALFAMDARAPAFGADEIYELEERLLTSRSSIRRGRCQFEILNRTSQLPELPTTAFRCDVLFDFDKDSVRVEYTYPGTQGNSGSIYEVDLVTPNDFLRLSTRNAEVVTPIAERKNRTLQQLSVFDPRALGMVSVGFERLGHYPIGELINRADRDALSLVENNDSGLTKYRFTLPAESGRPSECEIWLTPEFEHNPVRIEMRVFGKKYTTQYEVDVKYVKFGTTVYPSEVRFVKRRDSEVEQDQLVKTLAADFDSPVSETAFTLASISVPGAQDVMLPNGTVVRLGGKREELDAPDQDRSANVRWVLVAANCVFLALAIGLGMWFVFRSRKA